jgi:hypothetical protein
MTGTLSSVFKIAREGGAGAGVKIPVSTVLGEMARRSFGSTSPKVRQLPGGRSRSGSDVAL